MKRKLPTVLILLVMVLIGAMYWVDLSYYTDPASGFLVTGSVAARYAVLALPLVMSLLGLRTVGPAGMGALRVRNRSLALLFLLAAAVGVACGVTRVALSVSALAVYDILMGIAFTWCGVWMFLCALQLLVQTAPSPTAGALPGVLAALPFCVLTVYRVMIRPSSLYRLGPTIGCFAALLAMLWMGGLLRGLYIAMTLSRTRLAYMLGLFCFLFCTCLELPQAIFNALYSTTTPVALMESILLGVVGIAAAGTSLAIAGMPEVTQALEKE